MPTPVTNPRTVSDRAPEVVGFDRTAAGVATLDRWVELAARTLTGEGVSAGRLDLIFVDSEEMAALNEAHMGQPGPTDVLSFPLDGWADDDTGGVAEGADPEPPEAQDRPPLHLGDVVVCPEVATGQAAGHCGTVEAELALLVIHGVLHVLGHDHAEPEETAVMRDRERHHLAGLGLGHPDR